MELLKTAAGHLENLQEFSADNWENEIVGVALFHQEGVKDGIPEFSEVSKSCGNLAPLLSTLMLRPFDWHLLLRNWP